MRLHPPPSRILPTRHHYSSLSRPPTEIKNAQRAVRTASGCQWADLTLDQGRTRALRPRSSRAKPPPSRSRPDPKPGAAGQLERGARRITHRAPAKHRSHLTGAPGSHGAGPVAEPDSARDPSTTAGPASCSPALRRIAGAVEPAVEPAHRKRKTPRENGALLSTATGIRTRVSAMRGRRPSPLDDSGADERLEASREPRTRNARGCPAHSARELPATAAAERVSACDIFALR